MARKYTKVEGLYDVIRERKAAGETNRAIGESYGLSLKQVKGLISCFCSTAYYSVLEWYSKMHFQVVSL